MKCSGFQESLRLKASLSIQVSMFLHYRLQKYIEKMSPEEFQSNKQALAARRLEKPKKLPHLAAKFWMEILSQQYNFDRGKLLTKALPTLTFAAVSDRLEVECLESLTKEDVIAFFKVTAEFFWNIAPPFYKESPCICFYSRM